MKCQKDGFEVPENRTGSGYCSALHQYMSCVRCLYHEKNYKTRGGKV